MTYLIVFIILSIVTITFIKFNTKVITDDTRDQQERLDVRMNLIKGKHINI